jgi:hypothetical protein
VALIRAGVIVAGINGAVLSVKKEKVAGILKCSIFRDS